MAVFHYGAINMQTYSSFQELFNANTTNGIQFGTSNARVSGLERLPQEQRATTEQMTKAVLQAEQEFRAADDKLRQQETEAKQKVAQAQEYLKQVTSSRIAAANDFERKKAAFEAPLSKAAVTVTWDEPQVDATHIDVI
jgi:hypothetical protein